MKQFFGMSQQGNLTEAVRGLAKPQLIMLFSNDKQFEAHVNELEKLYPQVPSIGCIGMCYDTKVVEKGVGVIAFCEGVSAAANVLEQVSVMPVKYIKRLQDDVKRINGMQDMEQIYTQYFETVNKYLFCLTHNNDISEELTQETFYKAVKKIDTYKGECKMSVWLCQIAKNLWYDYCKKNKKVISVEKELVETYSSDTTEEKVILNDEKISLFRKIQKLDEKTREVIYLRITGELSFKEIGIILNKTENWARVTFYRGKNQLKEVD